MTPKTQKKMTEPPELNVCLAGGRGDHRLGLRNRFFMSLKTKLVVLFLAIAVIPLVLVSILTFHSYRHSMEEACLSDLQNVAAVKADMIEAHFSKLGSDIEIAQNFYNIKKNLPILAGIAPRITDPGFLAAKEDLDGQLRRMQSVLKLSNIMLLSPEGQVLYSSDPEHWERDHLQFLAGPQREAFERGRTQVSISDIYFDAIDGPKSAMLATAPLVDPHKVLRGVIAFEVDMAPIYEWIQDTTGLGRTGETLLGKKIDDKVLFINPLRHDPDAAFKRSIALGGAEAIPIQNAIRGQNGAGISVDYRGKQVVAAWHYLPSLQWGVVAKIDAEEAFADVHNLGNLVLIILALVILLVGIIAFSVAQSISGPIQKLSKGVEIIGSGNLDHKVGTRLQDEIGQLSRAFDKMVYDLKQAMLSRENERKRLYDLLETLPVYVILLSEDYHIPFANKFFRERFGASAGKRCYEYLFNRPEPCEHCGSYKAMKTNAPCHWEWLCPDGRNYDIYDFPFTDTDGSKMVMEMGIDITERKRAEAELTQHRDHLEALVKERTAQAEEKTAELQTILDSVPAMIFYKDKDNHFIRTNRAFENAMGKTRAELEGRSLFDLYPREEAETHWNDDKEVLVSGKPKYGIIENMTAKGEPRILLTDKMIYANERGEVAGIIGFSVDITERKQFEEALVNERANLQKIFDIVNVGMVLVDGSGAVQRVNDVISRWIGKEPVMTCNAQPGNVLGCIHALGHSAGCGQTSQCGTCAIRKTLSGVLSSGQPVHDVEAEAMFLIKGEEVRLHLAVSADPLVLNGKQHVILAISNITERKQAEEELRRRAVELQALNEELVRFNNVAVDRELRMISLKREINALSVAAGQPAPYPMNFEKGLA